MRIGMQIGILALSLIVAGSAGAQEKSKEKSKTKHEKKEQLKAEAKISESDARKTALAQVPGGRVESHELEREDGHLVYSYDIKVKGKSGVEEVHIDALNGSVLSNVHETPKQEKDEKKADKKEAKERKEAKKEMKDAAKKP